MIHRHKWGVAGVQVGHFVHGDETNVLHVCWKCHKRKVETLQGAWTWREVTGEEGYEMHTLHSEAVSEA